MPLISLHSFCKAHGFPKSSVHTYLSKDCGFNLSSGLTLQAQELAMERFGRRVKAALPPTDVFAGEEGAQQSLDLPPSSVELGQFRRPSTVNPLENPNEFIDGLNQFLDRIEEGMTAAELSQENKLQETRKLAQQGQQRLNQFRLRASEFRMKSFVLDSLQEKENNSLSDLADEASAMGKSQAPSA